MTCCHLAYFSLANPSDYFGQVISAETSIPETSRVQTKLHFWVNCAFKPLFCWQQDEVLEVQKFKSAILLSVLCGRVAECFFFCHVGTLVGVELQGKSDSHHQAASSEGLPLITSRSGGFHSELLSFPGCSSAVQTEASSTARPREGR